MSEEIDQETHDMVVAFEEQHGTEALIKVGLAVINRILVDEGLTTVEFLQRMAKEEMKTWDDDERKAE